MVIDGRRDVTPPQPVESLPNNVWMAARYTVPGFVAHKSATHGGELLPIPDFGDPLWPAGADHSGLEESVVTMAGDQATP